MSNTTPLSDSVRPESGRLRRYLLGVLDDAEQAELEHQYFEDDELFGALLGAEDDLVADYLGDRLSAEEGERFRRSYLATPAGRERVRIALALGDVARLPGTTVSASPTPATARRWERPRWDQWLAVAAALAVVVGGAVSWREVTRLRTGVQDLTSASEVLRRDLDAAQADAASERARADRSVAELAQLRAAASANPASGPPARIVALSLVPVALRGGTVADRVAIGPGTTVVELELAVDAPQPLDAVRVSVATDGPALWQADMTAGVQTPAVLRVPIPASVLTPGAIHTATLERLEGGRSAAIVHRYAFRVAAR